MDESVNLCKLNLQRFFIFCLDFSHNSLDIIYIIYKDQDEWRFTMSKFVCKILSRMLQSQSGRPFAEKCVKLVVKYHLLSSSIKDRLRSKKDFYYDLDAQFA